MNTFNIQEKPSMSKVDAFLAEVEARADTMQEEAIGDVSEEIRCLRQVYVDEQPTLATFLQANKAMREAGADILTLVKMVRELRK